MNKIIRDESVYTIEIQTGGLWVKWRPFDYWSFERKESPKDEFKAYDEAVKAAQNDNLTNYRIIKTQTIISIEYDEQN